MTSEYTRYSMLNCIELVNASSHSTLLQPSYSNGLSGVVLELATGSCDQLIEEEP